MNGPDRASSQRRLPQGAVTIAVAVPVAAGLVMELVVSPLLALWRERVERCGTRRAS